MHSATPTSKLPIIVASVIVALGVARGYQITNNSSGIDYFHIWAVPEIANSTSIPSCIYDARMHSELLDQFQIRHITDKPESDSKQRLQGWLDENRKLYKSGLLPTGSPFFYYANSRHKTGDAETDFWIFQIGCTVLFIVGIVLFGRACGIELWKSLSFAGLLLLLHRGLQSDIGVANVNRVQVFLFAMAIWPIGKPLQGDSPKSLPLKGSVCWLVSGFVFGLATLYKPNMLVAPLLMWVALILDSHWKRAIANAIGFAIGCCLGIGLTSLFFGWGSSDLWWEWRDYLTTIVHEPFALEAGNYSLTAWLFRAEFLENASLGITLSLAVGVGFWLWMTRSIEFQHRRYWLSAAMGLVIPLATGPVMWGHYLVLSVPVAMILLFGFVDLQKYWATMLAGIGLALTGIVPVTWIGDIAPHWILISLQFGLGLLIVASLGLLYRNCNVGTLHK